MHASQVRPTARILGPMGLLLSAAITAVVLSTNGLAPETPRAAGAASATFAFLSAAPLPLAYLLGAMGIGRLLLLGPARRSAHRHALQLGLGLAASLWLSHALGALGLLSGDGWVPRLVAWGSIALGLLLLLDQLVRGSLRPERWPVWSWTLVLWGPPVGLLAVAALNPPGFLWASEFGAFDALSYHLQLPKQWGAPGAALSSVPHNVYSFLPSYVEAAFLHLAAMSPTTGGVVDRTVGGEGPWIISCQLLHAGIAVIAGLLSARATIAFIERAVPDLPHALRGAIGSISGLLLLATPWTIITGSLAYNEAAVLALGAAGTLAASDRALSPAAASAFAAWCVGIATSAKPTAAFLVGPLVGLILLWSTGPRHWPRVIAFGTLLGIVSVAPWLIRNALAGGNPVFPFASSLFGSAHWSPDQVARYAHSHAANLPLIDRFARLFSPAFGLAHPQFGPAGIALALAAALSLANRATHRAAAIVTSAALAALLAWMTLTHLQSRFLMPLLLHTSLLSGLAAAAFARRCAPAAGSSSQRPAAAISALILFALGSTFISLLLFLRDGAGTPNRMLVGGPGAMSGLAFEQSFEHASDDERERAVAESGAGPAWYINLVLKPHQAPVGDILLLGDSAPLYFAAAMGDLPPAPTTSRVLYHTTWDRSPLGDAIAANPADPPAWTRTLFDRGIRFVLINFDELARLIEKDHYYDQRVTTADISRWLGLRPPSSTDDLPTGLIPVRRWPRHNADPRVPSGHALYRLAAPHHSTQPDPSALAQ